MSVGVLRVPRQVAALHLDEAIYAAQLEDPLAPVTVVAPSALAATRLGDRLIQLRRGHPERPAGLANVSFVTLARLAAELGAGSLEQVGRRRLTRTALSAAVRNSLGHDGTAFGRSTAHPATASEVTERYEELRFAGAIGPSSDRQLSRRARELLGLCVRVRAGIEATTYDDVDLFEAAAEVVGRGAGAELGAIVVYLPERSRPVELALLKALSTAHPLRVIVATVGGDTGGTGIPEVGEELWRRFELGLGVECTVVSADTVQAVTDQLLLGPSPRSEVRAASRLVLESLERGVAPDQIGLAYANREPYLRLLAEELRGAGIPYTGPGTEPLSSEIPGRMLLSLLELRGPRVRRDTLVAFLRSAPLVDGHRRPIPVAEWDRLTRRLGIVELTMGQWRSRLAEVRGEPDDSPDAPPPRRESRVAGELEEFLARCEEDLGALEHASGWNELAAWALAALERLLGNAGERRGWTVESTAAYDVTVDLLEQLRALDDLEPGMRPADFALRLTEELRRPGPRAGRRSSGVIVGPLDQLVACDLELAVLVGASAANFPPMGQRSPLLDGGDRDELGLEPISPRTNAARARRLLGLVRSGVAELVVTAPVLDESGRATVISRLVPEPLMRVSLPGEVGSLADVRRGVPARTATELETALLFGESPRQAALEASALGLAETARRLEIVGARDRGEFGVYSGLIGAGLARMDDRPYSPTSLEAIAVCPFRHFLDHVISCEALDAPERRIEIDPRDRGSIVHEALEQFVAARIEDPSLGDADPAEVLRTTAEAVIARYTRSGRTGKRVVFELEHRRILENLELERRTDEQRLLVSGSRPLAVEHGFGFGEVPPVAVELEHRTVFFRGLIDRIDLAADGSVDVIDYKTGSAKGFAGIMNDPIDGGRHLQLPIYALAARAFLDAPGMPVRAAFRFVGPVPEEIGLAVSERTERRLVEALTVLTDTVEDGVLPMRPGPVDFGGPVNCRWCDYTSVCPPERQRMFEGAVGSGLLDRYLELTDETIGFDEAEAMETACEPPAVVAEDE